MTQHVYDRYGSCTEYMDVRRARVTGRIYVVVPGVAVAPLANGNPAESELREQRVVCS